MGNESNMEKFLEELTCNDELRSMFLAQRSMDGAYAIAEKYLGDMSKEEFSEEMTGLARNIIESGSLTDEMLENVSGGFRGANIPSWTLVASAAKFGKIK